MKRLNIAVIGLGGIALAFLSLGKQLLFFSPEFVLTILAPLLFLTSLAYMFGLLKGVSDQVEKSIPSEQKDCLEPKVYRKLRVEKKYLLLTSGLIWMGIGIFLISLATRWGNEHQVDQMILYVLTGLVGGMLIRIFGFSRIVRRNVERIDSMDARVSIFAFQSSSSYLLVVIMMSMGMFIRHSSLLPLVLKIPGYYSIGVALLTSSIGYYRAFLPR